MTYTFTAGSPGTYLYESGTDVNKQVQMGLYGALVVRPAGGAAQVNDRPDSAFNTANEYVFLLSEVDPDVHLAVERSQPIDWNTYRARYFMINGRSMPDTLAPNNASWLPTQPYGALVHIKPYDAATNPLPATIRYLNAGTVNYPFHPHGSDERVINRDGHALQGPNGEDLSYQKYDIDVGPGQTVDILMDWRDVGELECDHQPDPDPDTSDHRPDFWSGQTPGSARAATWARRTRYLPRSPRTTSAASTTTSRTATRSSKQPTTEQPSGE